MALELALVGNTEEKGVLVRRRHRGENNIKMYVKQQG
jgi:hypothetical protein